MGFLNMDLLNADLLNATLLNTALLNIDLLNTDLLNTVFPNYSLAKYILVERSLFKYCLAERSPAGSSLIKHILAKHRLSDTDLNIRRGQTIALPNTSEKISFPKSALRTPAAGQKRETRTASLRARLPLYSSLWPFSFTSVTGTPESASSPPKAWTALRRARRSPYR